jgi:hypothetical protein
MGVVPGRAGNNGMQVCLRVLHLPVNVGLIVVLVVSPAIGSVPGERSRSMLQCWLLQTQHPVLHEASGLDG